MFGITMIDVKTKAPYTIEELYEKIKDIPFEAGVPELLHYGFAHAICFPEQDRNNQVQIYVNKKGKVQVMRSTQPMGLQKVLENVSMDHLTDGISSLSMLGGKKKKLCEELARRTAQQLNNLDL